MISPQEQEIKEQSFHQYLKEQVDLELVTDVADLLQQDNKTRRMVLQKFGVVPPQLTASEKNLIIREERLCRQ